MVNPLPEGETEQEQPLRGENPVDFPDRSVKIENVFEDTATENSLEFPVLDSVHVLDIKN